MANSARRQHRVELMGAHVDRHQRVSAGVVMIEAAGQPFAVGDGQIELELVGAACRRIGPRSISDHRTAVAKVDPAFPFRLDPRGMIEKPREFGERDRLLVVEAARRMTFAQQLCDRRDRSPKPRPMSLRRSIFLPGQRAAPPAAEPSRRHRDKVRRSGWPAGLPCCGCGTEDRESPTERGCRRPRSIGGHRRRLRRS